VRSAIDEHRNGAVGKHFGLAAKHNSRNSPPAMSGHREPVSDIDTGVVDSLKALDPDGRLEKTRPLR
jgi:hypothetical protein